MLDSTLVEKQTNNNLETAEYWELYAEHRRRVNSLIEPAGSADRLCILGAGNCNSFDLASLTSRFEQVHLCDLDPAALNRAIQRQSRDTHERIYTHAPIDVSGVLARLPSWAQAPPEVDVLRSLPQQVSAELGRRLPGPFDVVVSEGLLSQILFTCALKLGDGPLLMAVIPFVLLAHLRTLLELTQPGGTCILVTDTAFSDSSSEFGVQSASEGLAVLQELDRQGKLFTGTSPSLVTRALREQNLAERVESLQATSPWHWQFLKTRSAVVYGLILRAKKATHNPS